MPDPIVYQENPEEQDEEKGVKKKSLKRKSGEKSEKAKVRQISSEDLSERRSSSEESNSSRVMVPTSMSFFTLFCLIEKLVHWVLQILTQGKC